MKTEVIEPEEYFQVGQQDNRLLIYLRYPLFKALDEFTTKESGREQLGLLVGRFGQRPDKVPFVLIEDAVESTAAGDQFNFLEEGLWKRAGKIAIARHPTREVVGWFHALTGGGAGLTGDEVAVHKRFFLEDHQVLYKIEQKGKDRIFFSKIQGTPSPLSGFCIYGKQPQEADGKGKGEATAKSLPTPKSLPTAKSSGLPPSAAASSEQVLAYLDRSMEKIQRRLQKPPLTPKDVLIIALLMVNAALILFRPSPTAKVDTTGIERNQSEISAQVTEVRERIGKLEQHLADLQLLDQQLKIAAGEEHISGLGDELPPGDLGPSPKAQDIASPNPTPSSGADSALVGGQGQIKLYTVVKNDTLSAIVAKNYPGSGSDLIEDFAQYNRLKGPNYNIFEGDVLKIPDEKDLH